MISAIGVSTASGLGLLSIFILAIFVGYEVISKVSSILHTPLMSGANAIHGVILIGSMLILGSADGGAEIGLGVVAVILATANVVGGFVVTDRMLEMFKSRGPGGRDKAGPGGRAKAGADGGEPGSERG
jgi:NAD(P) transhydrogenase subunit alpha